MPPRGTYRMGHCLFSRKHKWPELRLEKTIRKVPKSYAVIKLSIANLWLHLSSLTQRPWCCGIGERHTILGHLCEDHSRARRAYSHTQFGNLRQKPGK